MKNVTVVSGGRIPKVASSTRRSGGTIAALILLCIQAIGQAQSWTSRDKIVLTYFFYWYNVHTGEGFGTTPGQNGTTTLHPPDSYVSTYAWTDVAYFQREFSDMAAAGVDVALPVYWGDPASSSRWGLPGLQTMVQAQQAMAQSGQPAPRIGMFLDTTSLQVRNNGVPPDLTTSTWKAAFYGDVHTFFTQVPRQFWATIDGHPIIVPYATSFLSAWDQSTIDYVVQHFQADFGTTPYIIRHASWTGVTTDATVDGWATWYSANFVGDVASVSPGEDNTNVAAFENRRLVVDRNCGDLYQQHWNQVVSHGARLVFIEDWNELYEGSGISATKEYGRRYIDQTARNVTQWKTAASPPTSSPSIVWASLGSKDYLNGVYPGANYGDGTWLTTRIAGHDAMYTDRKATLTGYYLYLAVDDRFQTAKPSPVWVSVEYLDTGNTPWRLEYNGANSRAAATAPVIPQNTGLWKVQTFYLPDAAFQKGLATGNSDFRIDDYNTQGVVHYFNRVWLTKSAPTGLPPQMPLVGDITVAPGSPVDVRLSVSDSAGNPLAASFVGNPPFVSISGGAGAQLLHFAPSSSDVRSCSDVSGGGVTSSPSYAVTATATDPASQLTGATTFAVTVNASPALNLSPPTAALTAVAGSTAAVTANITITNTAGTAFLSNTSFTAQSTGGWLQAQAAAGTAGTASLQVSANPSGMDAGTYVGMVTISALGFLQPSLTIPVTFTITAPGTLGISGRTVVFQSQPAQDPPVQTVSISNTGPAGSVLNWTAAVSTATGGNWLSVNPASGTNNATLQIVARVVSLTAGTHSGTVTLSAPGAQNSPVTIAVTLNIAQPPVVQAIVDSWGYSAGIAPGLWVTIAGTNLAAGAPLTWNLSGTQALPTTVGGATVTFNGTPAALFYVSATQINALVPSTVAPGPVRVVVQSNGLISAPFMVTATATQPAVYAPPQADGSAFFVTAALQGTGYLVGNSATDPRVARRVYPGDILDLYMIGLGATSDPSGFVTDKPFAAAFPVSAKVTATVGAKVAPVLFAGLTSPGLYLMRVAIPMDIEPGQQPIQISAGDASTIPALVLTVGASPANLLQNGSFESPLAGNWQFVVDSSRNAVASIQRTTSTDTDGGYSAEVTVTAAASGTPATDITAVQLWQPGIAVQQGQVYALQFWAKADTSRTMRVTVTQNGVNQNYGLFTAVALGPDWQRYVIYFRATGTDPAARFNLSFGDQTGSTWVDGVQLQ